MTEGSEFESRWGQEFSLLHVVQTGSGVHQTSYPMGTGGKAAGAWSWQLTSNYCRGQENMENNERGSERLVYCHPGWGEFIFKSFAVKASHSNMLLKKLAKRSTSPPVLAEWCNACTLCVGTRSSSSGYYRISVRIWSSRRLTVFNAPPTSCPVARKIVTPNAG
jgi:hypothetical protein